MISSNLLNLLASLGGKSFIFYSTFYAIFLAISKAGKCFQGVRIAQKMKSIFSIPIKWKNKIAIIKLHNVYGTCVLVYVIAAGDVVLFFSLFCCCHFSLFFFISLLLLLCFSVVFFCCCFVFLVLKLVLSCVCGEGGGVIKAALINISL